MSRKLEKKCETRLKMGGMTQFAGQEKVGGAWESEVAKCMQYPLTQNKLYHMNFLSWKVGIQHPITKSLLYTFMGKLLLF